MLHAITVVYLQACRVSISLVEVEFLEQVSTVFRAHAGMSGVQVF